jgi:hypothetical protein
LTEAPDLVAGLWRPLQMEKLCNKLCSTAY